MDVFIESGNHNIDYMAQLFSFLGTNWLHFSDDAEKKQASSAGDEMLGWIRHGTKELAKSAKKLTKKSNKIIIPPWIRD